MPAEASPEAETPAANSSSFGFMAQNQSSTFQNEPIPNDGGMMMAATAQPPMDGAAGGSAFSFMGSGGAPAEALKLQPGDAGFKSAFCVDDGNDTSGSYAQQCADQLALDPGYKLPEEEAPPPGSSFGINIQSGPVGGDGVGGDQMAMSDPGTPAASGFGFINSGNAGPPPADLGAPSEGEPQGGGFGFINNTAAVEVTAVSSFPLTPRCFP